MKLQVLCGMVASGKSTYSRNAARDGVICINDDTIVTMLHGDNYISYNADLKVLYKSIENHIIATSLAMGRSVIVDRGLNLSLEGRRRWIALARSFDVLCEAIIFKNDGPEIHAKRRTDADSRGHSLEYWMRVAEHHNSLYIPPVIEEGFSAVYNISFDDIQRGRII